MKKNDALVRQFTTFLANLPSESLRELAKTEDLLKEWHHLKNYNSLVAGCWCAKRFGRLDPLALLVDDGTLDPFVRVHAWGIADFYDRLWELVLVVEDSVRYVCDHHSINYPFNCPSELFLEILRTQEDNTFKLRLKSYVEISPKKLQKASKAMAKGEGGDHLEFSNVKGWLSQLNTGVPGQSANYWLSLTLRIAWFLEQKNDRLVRGKLEDFKNAVRRLAEANATGLRKRSSRTWNQISAHAWINGEKVSVSGQGNVYT